MIIVIYCTICYTSTWTVFKADSPTWEYMIILSTSWFFVLSACQAICTYIQIWNGFPRAIYQLQVLINSMAPRDESREWRTPLRPFPQGNSTRFEHRNLEHLCTILSVSHTALPGAQISRCHLWANIATELQNCCWSSTTMVIDEKSKGTCRVSFLHGLLRIFLPQK